jgi:KDO2-lipid IV(A) lauroyltransferase
MGHGSIPHSDMRGLLRALKAKHIVWYTPDQDFGARHSVFVPFFGNPAATITMPSRLAESVDCYVATVCFHRDGLTNNYTMEFSAPLENFPSGDVIADASRINLALEACIKKHPTQYMWYHRRFKSQPEGAEPVYPPKRPRWQK